MQDHSDPEQELEARERARQQRVDGLRGDLARRPEPPSAFICEAIAAAVSESLVDGEFGHYLRARGWELVYIGDDGPCPPAPAEFLDQALNLMEPGWRDPIEQVERLWETAWTAGHRAAAAVGPGREASGSSPGIDGQGESQ